MDIKHGHEARSLRTAVRAWRYEPRVSARGGPCGQATHLNAPTTNVPPIRCTVGGLRTRIARALACRYLPCSVHFLAAIAPAPNSQAALHARIIRAKQIVAIAGVSAAPCRMRRLETAVGLRQRAVPARPRSWRQSATMPNGLTLTTSVPAHLGIESDGRRGTSLKANRYVG